MRLHSKTEYFELDSPIGEPNYDWKRFNGDQKYGIQRQLKEDESVIWYGLDTNWLKEKDGEWTVLTKNEKAIPIGYTEDTVPEPYYGDDRWIFVPCEMPIYEKLYQEQYAI